tara:strand:- start:312 stop:572 length:261 start_codon:yes stop_codon:yes gene_type:complete
MLEAKTNRINTDRGIVQSVIDLNIIEPSSDPEPSDDEVEDDQHSAAQSHEEASNLEESIGDPVDWNQTPVTLGDETQWDDEIELLD